MDERLTTAVEQSWLGGLISDVADCSAQLSTASGASKIGGIVDHIVTRLSIVVAHSACVRWLIREPEPDVIVIDLAETRTVGPVIDLLQPVSNVLARSYLTSRINTVIATTEQKTQPFSAIITQSTSWTLLERLLIPPDPPERDE